MSLTRSQRKNLDKLATYLEGLPEDYEHFEMSGFIGLADSDPVVLEYVHKNGGLSKCGAVACAVGHGPAAGILFRSADIDEGRADWCAYSDRFASDANRCFSWAFSGLWDGGDNHHWGAAARIRYLLKHGTPPREYSYPGTDWMDAYRPFDKRHAPVQS